MNAKCLQREVMFLFLLVFVLIAGLYKIGVKVSGLENQVAELETSRGIAWFRQLVFEGRVRGLKNSSLVFFGHPAPAYGYFFTIGEMDERMGIGPYGANTYVNVAAGNPLNVFLRSEDGTVVDSFILNGLKPGDLVIAWFTDEPLSSSTEPTSPDDWRLPVAYRRGGILVAIDHFAGETR